MRQDGDQLVPYYTRAEIEAGALQGRGLELLYLDDPIELFFMQVQGSGRVRLTDGSWVRLGYAAKNGHSYTSIGRLLLERGEGLPGADDGRPEELAAGGSGAGAGADAGEQVLRLLPRIAAGGSRRGPGRRAGRAADAGAQPRRRRGLSCARDADFRRGARSCGRRRAVSPADDRPRRRFGDQRAPARGYLFWHRRRCRRHRRHDQGGGGV